MQTYRVPQKTSKRRRVGHSTPIYAPSTQKAYVRSSMHHRRRRHRRSLPTSTSSGSASCASWARAGSPTTGASLARRRGPTRWQTAPTMSMSRSTAVRSRQRRACPYRWSSRTSCSTSALCAQFTARACTFCRRRRHRRPWCRRLHHLTFHRRPCRRRRQAPVRHRRRRLRRPNCCTLRGNTGSAPNKATTTLVSSDS